MLEMMKVWKNLSANDVSANSHQQGIHVSKDVVEFFPSLDTLNTNPEKPLEIVDQRGSERWHFRLKYYNSKSEYRIIGGSERNTDNTSIQKYLEGVSPQDVMVFHKYGDIYRVEWPDSSYIPSECEQVTTVGQGAWRICWGNRDSTLRGIIEEDDLEPNPEAEHLIQKSSAITGKKAEDYFQEYAAKKLLSWGIPEDRTDKTGFGHDFYFPDNGYMVEVKGSTGQIETVRMTAKEWEAAQQNGNSYWLAIVAQLDKESFDEPEVHMIRDPFTWLKNNAKPRTVKQVYYSISAGDLLTLLR